MMVILLTPVTLVTLVTLFTLVTLITLATLVCLATLVTLITLATLVTLVTLFRSANQFYRAKCIIVSGFFFVIYDGWLGAANLWVVFAGDRRVGDRRPCTALTSPDKPR